MSKRAPEIDTCMYCEKQRYCALLPDYEGRFYSPICESCLMSFYSDIQLAKASATTLFEEELAKSGATVDTMKKGIELGAITKEEATTRLLYIYGEKLKAEL